MSNSPDAVVRQWFKDVWDEGREEAIDRLAAADMTIHGLPGPGPAPLRGTGAFKQIFYTFREALGDLEIAVERTVTEGEMCAAYCRVRGHHVGGALGGAPSNKPVEFNGIVIAVVKDGRIVEGWNCFDFLTMYQQMGWVGDPVLPR